jgi:hypothetical protein
MNIPRVFFKSNLLITLFTFLILFPITGCYDDPVSPCHNCWTPDDNGLYTDVIERTFTGDGLATIYVELFDGSVTYRTGKPGEIRVTATRRAPRRSDLDRIIVTMTAHHGGVDICADNPRNVRNASVDLEITAPASAIPRINAGVGNIDYSGRPGEGCRFTTGVGLIRLRLYSDVNITVDLSVAVGMIYLDFPVDGRVSSLPGVVRGTIGSGDEGHVYARSAVGNIYLVHW